MSASTLDGPEAAPTALRGGMIRVGGYVAGMLISLASAPILLHHLGVAGYGRYATVTVLIGLLGTATEAGLSAIALREYATREGSERRLVMRHLLAIRLAVTGAGVVVALAFAVVSGYDDVLLLGVVVSGAGLLCIMVQSLVVVPLHAELRFGQATALVLLRQALATAAIIALAVAGATLGWFFAAGAFAGAVSLVATVLVVRSGMPLRPTVDPRAWGDLLRDTVPYAIATAIYAAYFRMAVIVLSLRSSDTETGVFATSYRIIELMVIVPGILVTTAFPILARAERHDGVRFDRATVRLVELALLAGTASVVALVLAAPLIIDFLAPAEGRPAVEVLRIQAPAILATFVAISCTYPLLARRRHSSILIANAIAFVAITALTVAVVGGSHAARWAAAATTVAEFLLCGVIVVLLRRDVPGLTRAARKLAPLALAAGAGLAVLAVPGIPAAGDTALGLALFAGVLLAVAGPPDELVHLRRRARRE